jgi:hypothetical protein
MISFVVTTGEGSNWTINTQGLVESKTNQFTIKKETLYLSTNCGDEDMETNVTTQQDDELIRTNSDQFMEEWNELDFEQVFN